MEETIHAILYSDSVETQELSFAHVFTSKTILEPVLIAHLASNSL